MNPPRWHRRHAYRARISETMTTPPAYDDADPYNAPMTSAEHAYGLLILLSPVLVPLSWAAVVLAIEAC